MRLSAKIMIAFGLAVAIYPRMGRAEEVLPALSDEKLGEYKNAFGKAISDSRAALPAQPGSPALHDVTRRMHDDFEQKGPPPAASGNHPPGGGFPPGPPGFMPGSPNGGPPPGAGGPGQPGGPRPPNSGNGPPGPR